MGVFNSQQNLICNGQDFSIDIGSPVSGFTYRAFLNGNYTTPVGTFSSPTITIPSGSFNNGDEVTVIGFSVPNDSMSYLVGCYESITVTPLNTVTLTSGAGTDGQTVCVGSSITNITYDITGATSVNVTGLPSGVTFSYSAPTLTISGTPSTTVGSPFTYSITTTGGCPDVPVNGTITVDPLNTVTLTSGAGTDGQIVCVGSSITNITYDITGATSVNVTGLPSGVTFNYTAPTLTISGTPTTTLGSPFTYSITTTGGCPDVPVTGTITVDPLNTVSLTSGAGTDAQTVCVGNAITNITYDITGATSVNVTGLPSGVSFNYTAPTLTISGTPTTTLGSPFTYSITTTGGCPDVPVTGTITVDPLNTVSLTSGAGTDAQTVCVGNAITNITYDITGATSVNVTGLPSGVSFNYTAPTLTISGTPTTTLGSPFTYSITTTGGCPDVPVTGTITVDPLNTVSLTSGAGTDAQTVCVGNAITNITYDITGATSVNVTGLPSGVSFNYTAPTLTISGTPTTTLGSPFTYSITTTGGCPDVPVTGTITVDPLNTVSLTSGAGTDAQTVCVGNAITNITYDITGATSVNVTGLPSGVSFNYTAPTLTISGTPTTTLGSPFTYSITTTGGCPDVPVTGTITVDPLNTVSLTSGAGTDAQTVCVGNAITNITYDITGATSVNVTGLPSGVSFNYTAPTLTISGTPTTTLGSPFTYSITTTGGCPDVPVTGTITVDPLNTVSLTSGAGTDAQTVCVGNAITNITYDITGATSVNVTGLPSGVSFNYTAPTLTISGTPTTTLGSPFTYSITTTGGCPDVPVTGTITVDPLNTVSLTSGAGTDAQTVCVGNAITNITYDITGATSVNVTGLPSGVSFNYTAPTLTISGTPTTTLGSPFTYSITTTGGCPDVPVTGTITVDPLNTVSLTSGAGTDAQTVCVGNAITNITYDITGATSVNVTGLPSGVSFNYTAPTLTISGTPTTTLGSPFTYSITTTGGCPDVPVTGTITVDPLNTVSLTSGAGTDAQTVCVGNAITNITYDITGATSVNVTGLPSGVSFNYTAPTLTISGTPTTTLGSPFTYSITTTGGCPDVPVTGTITVDPLNTVSLTSGAGTDAQTVCVGNAITNITYDITGATSVNVTGLPSGVSFNYTAPTLTISGTPTTTLGSPFTYSITTTGGCPDVPVTGTITVDPLNTVSLTSGAGTDAQTVCVGNAITNITYDITGATSVNVTGLPSGVSFNYTAPTLTISGTPTTTLGSPFTYSITTTGGCPDVPVTGTITVDPLNTVSLTSGAGTDAQTVCVGNAITNITYDITGATSVNVTGLPSGVSFNYTAPTLTISGTPTTTLGSPFTYSITTTGGCPDVPVTGTITVDPLNTVSLTSGAGTDAQTVCVGNAITNITYDITGATSVNVTGLPSGVSFNYTAPTLTISGTPTTTLGSPFTYSITTTGGCPDVPVTGTITVDPLNTVSLTSGAGTDAQTVCVGNAITNITYDITGATSVNVTGLPSGVSFNYTAPTLTISGTPTTTLGSPFTYSITTTGGCPDVPVTGTITVDPLNTVSLTSGAGTDAQTVCVGNAITNITYDITGATSVNVTGLPSGVSFNYTAPTLTISGTPTTTLGSPFTYSITTTGGCPDVPVTGTITVDPLNTVSLTSGAGTDAQTVCVGNAITNITYDITGATSVNVTGLPSGVSFNYTAPTLTISGTPTTTLGSPFTYSITTTGGCPDVPVTGTITVDPLNTVSLTSGAGTDAQTVCVGNAITNITYDITGATSVNVTGLPSGVSFNYTAPTLTISGTPTTTLGSPFTYSITTTGGCPDVPVTGTITVDPLNTVSLTSGAGTDAQTVCVGNAITNITYDITGATSVNVTGLPSGVSFNYTAPTLTISGTPTTTLGSPFTYSITTTGGCPDVPVTGTITVDPLNTVSLTSGAGTDAQTVCVGECNNQYYV
ncbi:MAG: hypothetical protein KatS3mg035_0814 [Bacteroidia bacterium]|nr:MAG: hypothetical protein KatS3mg035_0814 [Bacteroidia bacterium]